MGPVNTVLQGYNGRQTCERQIDECYMCLSVSRLSGYRLMGELHGSLLRVGQTYLEYGTTQDVGGVRFRGDTLSHIYKNTS